MQTPKLLQHLLSDETKFASVHTALELYLRHHDLGEIQKLTWLQCLELLFDAHWERATRKSNIKLFHFICFRVEALELVIQAMPQDCMLTHKNYVEPFSVVQKMTMWLSAHVPLWIWFSSKTKESTNAEDVTRVPRARWPCMSKSIGPHLLPDASGTIHNLDFGNNLGSKSGNSSAFAHIICKALPRRCQIRELARFLCDYFQQYDLLSVVFDRMLLLSMTGLYPAVHCTQNKIMQVVPCWHFETLVSMYVTFLIPTDTNVSKFLIHGAEHEHSNELQALYFYVIREFLLYSVQIMPAVHTLLRQRYEWLEFEGTVKAHMNFARCKIAQVLETGDLDYLPIKQFMYTLQSQIAKSRSNNVCPRNLSLRDGLQQLLHLFTKELQTLDAAEWDVVLVTFSQMLNADQKQCVGLANRSTASSCHKLDSMAEIQSRSTVAALLQSVQIANWKQATVLIKQLRKTDSHRFFRLYHECFMGQCALQTQVHMLPMHVWVTQTTATAAVWYNQSLYHLPPQMNSLLICKSCGDIKCSHDKQQRKSRGKKQVPPTIGSVDVIVDDNLLQMCCTKGSKFSCAHTTTKFEDQLLADVAESDLEVNNAQPNLAITHSVVELNNMYCNKLPIMHVHLIGNVVYHANSCYTVCTQCACITELDNERRFQLLCSTCAKTSNSEIMKHLCAVEPANRCTLCKTNVSVESCKYMRFFDCNKQQLIVQRTVCLACVKLMNKTNREMHTSFEAQQLVLLHRCQRDIRQLKMKRKFGN